MHVFHRVESWCRGRSHVGNDCRLQSIAHTSELDFIDAAQTSERVDDAVEHVSVVNVVGRRVVDVNSQLLQGMVVHQERSEVQQAALETEACDVLRAIIEHDVDVQFLDLSKFGRTKSPHLAVSFHWLDPN